MQRSFRIGPPLLLMAAAAGQVPVGSAVVSTIHEPTVPLAVLDRNTPPGVRAITGATLAPDINAIRLDPINGNLWMGSLASGALRVGRIDFALAQVVNDTLVATLPTSSITAIAFDIDGNPVAGGGSLNGSGGLWRVNRVTGAVTAMVDNAAGLLGSVNAIDEDPLTGNVYFGVFDTGNVYRIAPPYVLNSQVLVGSIASAINTDLSGLSFARTAAAPAGVLYVSAFGVQTNASIATMSPLTGAVNAIPGTPSWFNANWVDYDQARGDLWVGSTFAARSVAYATTAGANTLLHQFVTGFPSAVEANDVDPNRAQLEVFPRNVPVPTAAFRLELAVHGKPGETGIIAVSAPVIVVLGIGLVGPDGRFALTLPDLIYPAGAPGSLQFTGGTADLNTFANKISDPIPWPRN